MYLRMITKKAKWEQSLSMEIDALSSDLITGCLRTQGETLSLWRLESYEMVNEAIVALASNRELIQHLDYMIIPENKLSDYGFDIEFNCGHTPYEEFNKNHYDIIKLNYEKLGNVSQMILELNKSDSNKIVRVYQDDVKLLLKKAINEGKINEDKLKPKLKEALA